ncbi:hypothetical protein Mapa_006547 [Marchantia paleacea]|nr:hypothetical protein Mapa_006547 [Marchantia paleacea]
MRSRCPLFWSEPLRNGTRHRGTGGRSRLTAGGRRSRGRCAVLIGDFGDIDVGTYDHFHAILFSHL